MGRTRPGMWSGKTPCFCAKCKQRDTFKPDLQHSIYGESGGLISVRFKCTECGHLSSTYSVRAVKAAGISLE